jgi:Ankyrin repeats (3 copies)
MGPHTEPDQRILIEGQLYARARESNINFLNNVVEVPQAVRSSEGEQQVLPGHIDVAINIPHEVPLESSTLQRAKLVQSDDVAINFLNRIPPAICGPEREQQIQYDDVAINFENWHPPKSSRPARENQMQHSNAAFNIENESVTCGGDTALHTAAYFGQLEEATRIIQINRSLLLEVNINDETSLHYAAQVGKHKAVEHLIKMAQGDLFMIKRQNRDGETALYQAVHNKHLAVVKILLHHDPNLAKIPNNNNVSPLYLAAMRESPDVVACLIQYLHGKVSPEAYVGPAWKTALHAAAFKQKGTN